MKKRIELSREDKTFSFIVYLITTLVLLVIAYPVIYVISASFSSPAAVTTGKVVLLPVDFGLDGYKAVFQNKDILTGYFNTIYYTILGTVINVAVTLCAAYPMSRRDFPARRKFAFFFTFTMLFSGGMIPTYMVVKELGLLDTTWALVLPGAISVYNLTVTRSFLESSIPHEMLEAAQIDGCSDFQYFFRFVLPLSKAVIAVITLFYAVSHWNSYFNALLYINTRERYPLQLFLREILVNNKVDAAVMDEGIMNAKQGLADLLKYSLIVVSTLPIMCIYPFIQKYFVQGVMIGSVKG
ncbi:MAG: carbohydrate ABC transporter permease [Clostridia bacterium]|nr:carbohydrate ABC transporter permease [Clostridia bacterium]